ncbi:MAG: hypothetical protein DCC71_13025 [Proteobacteria bacterium]|nr:MAG: hypothetical protein DCC71_13025 [Pseudomonadota bacterium]
MSSAPGRYERYALIFDPSESRLGSEALGLVERGIDPLYVADVDEAHLLSLQEAGRVGALVVPGSLELDTLDVLLDRVAPQLWAGPASLVVVGPPDERAALRALRDRDVCWILREPYDAAEFRFVVAAALATEDKLDPRSGLRAPISLPVHVACDGVQRDAVIRNLSIGGAYVALDAPPAPGSAVRVDLELGDRAMQPEATVVYTQGSDAGGRAVREGGMGVAFRALEEPDRACIAAFIEDRVRCFRL